MHALQWGRRGAGQPRSAPARRAAAAGRLQQVTRSVFGEFVRTQACPTCSGSAAGSRQPCAECRGAGRVVEERTLAVEIPAGSIDGQRIQLSGEGHAGLVGGRAGDVYVEVRIRPTSGSCARETTSTRPSTSLHAGCARRDRHDPDARRGGGARASARHPARRDRRPARPRHARPAELRLRRRANPRQRARPRPAQRRAAPPPARVRRARRRADLREADSGFFDKLKKRVPLRRLCRRRRRARARAAAPHLPRGRRGARRRLRGLRRGAALGFDVVAVDGRHGRAGRTARRAVRGR